QRRPAPARPAATRPAPKPATTTQQPTGTAKPAAIPARPPSGAAKADDCGCEAETPPGVLAVVNGVRITLQEVDAAIKSDIQQLEQQVTEARKRELDLQISSLLLEAEAKKRGKTTEQLLNEEVVARTPEPTEAEARAFYEQNKARIQSGWSDDLKNQIVQYLSEQRQQDAAQKFADGLRATGQVTRNVAAATPPAGAAERARVFAHVNGAPVTSAMVEDSLKPLVFNVQQQIYQLRQRELDRRINDVLLDAEAKKRGVTPQAVLDAEAAKVRPISETDAQAFYNQNKERITGDFPTVKAQIVQYLQENAQATLLSALAEQLRSGAAIQTFLREPTAPVYQIGTDDQPARGAANAPVTIVEFTDFQCPSCAAEQPVLEQIMSEFDGRVRLVVRDYPLRQHANARKAAEAAEAARSLGKYWEYAQLLFANQSALDVPKLKEYASQVGLDRAKFDAMLDSGQYAKKVQDDANEGARVGVNATPSLFVNGRPVNDRTYEGLKAAITAALAEKGIR
ncbi:MAG: thioredoxin domain-containing protein, partial [Pyrinomonadaceae bacterium]